jgi:hypothetical protein
MSRNPTLAEVVNDATEAALAEVPIWMPGRVVRYDAATQQVDVQPIPKDRYFDEDGAAVVQARPVVPSVPVMFPGGGGYTVTFPIEVGDVVILLFSGVSIDKWLGASSDRELDPETHARHTLADAVAIPGIKSFARPRSSAPTDHVRIGTDGASVQGAGLGAEIASHFADLRSYLSTIIGPDLSLFNTHVHTGGTISGSTGVPSTTNALPLPTVPDVESGTVKITE